MNLFRDKNHAIEHVIDFGTALFALKSLQTPKDVLQNPVKAQNFEKFIVNRILYHVSYKTK